VRKSDYDVEKQNISETELSAAYPEGAPEEDASLARKDGRVAVSGGHLGYDCTAAEVDGQSTVRTTVVIVVTSLTSKCTVVVTTERKHLQPNTHSACTFTVFATVCFCWRLNPNL